MLNTHEVFNQPEPLTDYPLFDGNQALRDALKFNAPALDTSALSALGVKLGTAEMQAHARLASVNAPQLHTHDRFGRRIDQVEFHPSYHAVMGLAVQAGLHGTAWSHPTPADRPSEIRASGLKPADSAPASSASPHVERAAGFMLFTELEPSVLCPISMTYAATPALRANAAIFADWGPKLAARAYDSVLKPWQDKPGLTMGMGMTEKQGGSDVRANTTRATLSGQDGWGARYRLNGHKWFFSAPMCDAFLVLAQAPAGLSCFFLPRVLPDGQFNAIRIQRLKDKLGNQANASSEVEFDDAQAWLVGEEGRGISQILEMGTMTRLDCALGTSGLMRQALSLALNHTSQRQAFGKPLMDQALMKNVLADLAIESEAASALAIRLSRAFDHQDNAHERLMARLLTPVAKFWICKRGSAFAQEAMECLGGNGYVEAGGEGVMARIYREMPLNSIWEGAGNIMALDVLRACRKGQGGDVAAALAQELAPARRQLAEFDRFADALLQHIDDGFSEFEARQIATEVALAVQAALLCQHAPAAVFSAFCHSRLAGCSQVFGASLRSGHDVDSILQRAMPR